MLTGYVEGGFTDNDDLALLQYNSDTTPRLKTSNDRNDEAGGVTVEEKEKEEEDDYLDVLVLRHHVTPTCIRSSPHRCFMGYTGSLSCPFQYHNDPESIGKSKENSIIFMT